MKKFLLGLMAFVGMAVCFTACGDKDENSTPKQEKPLQNQELFYMIHTLRTTHIKMTIL